MKRKILIPAILAAVVTAGALGGSAAMAGQENQETSDAASLAQAKITLAQAIAAAEQNTGAKAFGAHIEDVNGTARFAVDVAKDKTVQTVLIDAQTGQVMKVAAAEGENGANNDQQESE